jgi:hypothetical protein
MTQIGVHRDDDVCGRRNEASCKRRTHPTIRPMTDHLKPGFARPQASEDLGGSVGRAVVNDKETPFIWHFSARGYHETFDDGFLVVSRRQDRHVHQTILGAWGQRVQP